MTKNPQAGSLFVVLLAVGALAQCVLLTACKDDNKKVFDSEKIGMMTGPNGAPSPVMTEHIHMEK